MTEPTFTYTGDPSRSDTDAVRWYVGDTNRRRPLLYDTEIAFALVQHPNVLGAAVVCAEALSAKFSSESDIKVGDISKALSKVSGQYRELAETLRRRLAQQAIPSFPATRVSTKQALEDDTDLTKPEFPIDLGDNPGVVQLNDAISGVGPFNGFF